MESNIKAIIWILVILTGIVQTSAPRSAQAQWPTGSDQDRSVRLELRNATIEQALGQLAEELEGNFICVDPNGGTVETLEIEKPSGQALREVCGHFGYEGGRWRRLLLARKQTHGGTLWERISTSLPENVRAELVLPPGETITVEALVGLAVNYLRAPEGSDAKEAGASQLCYAITWPQLVEAVRKFDRLTEGQAILGVKAPVWSPPFDFHKRLLVIWPVQPGEPEDIAVREELWVGYDQFREYLKARERADPLDVFVQRALEAARAREEAYADDPVLDQTVRLTARREAVQEVLQKLAEEAGLGLHGSREAGERLVSLEILDCSLRDVLRALSFLTESVLVQQEPGEYTLEAPNLLAERLTCALPVQLWATSQLTSVEQQLEWQRLCQEFWDGLTPAQQEKLETGFLKVSELTEEQRSLLRDVVSVGVGKALGKIMRNLPRRGLPAPLEMEEDHSSAERRLADGREYHDPLLRFKTPDYLLEFGFGLYQEVQARAAAPGE